MALFHTYCFSILTCENTAEFLCFSLQGQRQRTRHALTGKKISIFTAPTKDLHTTHRTPAFCSAEGREEGGIRVSLGSLSFLPDFALQFKLKTLKTRISAALSWLEMQRASSLSCCSATPRHQSRPAGCLPRSRWGSDCQRRNLRMWTLCEASCPDPQGHSESVLYWELPRWCCCCLALLKEKNCVRK